MEIKRTYLRYRSILTKCRERGLVWLLRRTCKEFYLPTTGPGRLLLRVTKPAYRIVKVARDVMEGEQEQVVPGMDDDALSIYCEHGINGAAAIRTEIAWLRRQGANIQGTVAHNSAALYGAENFEIFTNRALGGRRSFAWGERRAPLQVLDEKIRFEKVEVALRESDLAGWALPLREDRSVVASFGGRPLDLAVIEAAGSRYFGVPWRRTPVLDVLEEAKRFAPSVPR